MQDLNLKGSGRLWRNRYSLDDVLVVGVTGSEEEHAAQDEYFGEMFHFEVLSSLVLVKLQHHAKAIPTKGLK
jgi:hypothetical protein